MSQKTKQKVKTYIHNWLGSVEAYFRNDPRLRKKADLLFTFVTLTLPCTQNHTDQEIRRRALTPFITQLKRLHDVRQYIHVSEAQRNENIHFHLVIDRYVHHAEIRRLWNNYMDELGYIQDYRDAQNHFHKDGFKFRANLAHKWSFADQLEAYIRGKKDNWSNPNSTDIHSLRHVNNIAAYITKYITKSKNYRPIEGRLWGSSNDIKTIQPINITLRKKLRQPLMELAQFAGSRLFETDFSWTLWRFNRDELRDSFPTLYQIWYNFVTHCIRQLYPWLLKIPNKMSLSPPAHQTSFSLVPNFG